MAFIESVVIKRLSYPSPRFLNSSLNWTRTMDKVVKLVKLELVKLDNDDREGAHRATLSVTSLILISKNKWMKVVVFH